MVVLNVIIYALPDSGNSTNNCLNSGCHDKLVSENFKHQPAVKSCLTCHTTDIKLAHPTNPGKEFSMIKESPDLCLACHNKSIHSADRNIENISEKLKKKNIHSPVEFGCIDCHNPHSSNTSKLLVEEFPAGSYAEGKPENYAQCFTCHDQEILTANLTNSATKFRDGRKNLHTIHVGGDKGRKCTTCHDVHGSDLPILIKETVQFGNWKMPLNFKRNEDGGSCAPGCHKELAYTWKETKVLAEPKQEIAKGPDPDTVKISPVIEPIIVVEENEDVFVDELNVEPAPIKNSKIDTKSSDNKAKKSTSEKPRKIIIRKNVPKVFAIKESKSKNSEIINSSMKKYISSLIKYMKKYSKIRLQIDVEVEDEFIGETRLAKAFEYSASIANLMKSQGIAEQRLLIIPVQAKKKSKSKNTKSSKNISLKIIN